MIQLNACVEDGVTPLSSQIINLIIKQSAKVVKENLSWELLEDDNCRGFIVTEKNTAQIELFYGQAFALFLEFDEQRISIPFLINTLVIDRPTSDNYAKVNTAEIIRFPTFQ